MGLLSEWMCSPKFIYWNPNPQVAVVVGGAFVRWSERLVPLSQGLQREPLPASTMWGPGENASAAHDHAGALILDADPSDCEK